MTILLHPHEWQKIGKWPRYHEEFSFTISVPRITDNAGLLQDIDHALPLQFPLEYVNQIPERVRPSSGSIELVFFWMDPTNFADFQKEREKRGLVQDIGALLNFNKDQPKFARAYSMADVWKDQSDKYHYIYLGDSARTGFGYGVFGGQVDPNNGQNFFEQPLLSAGVRAKAEFSSEAVN